MHRHMYREISFMIANKHVREEIAKGTRWPQGYYMELFQMEVSDTTRRRCQQTTAAPRVYVQWLENSDQTRPTYFRKQNHSDSAKSVDGAMAK
jgi:hypothetical protein